MNGWKEGAIVRWWWRGGNAYLSDGETDEFARRPQSSIVTRYDSKHKCADQEALDLNPTSSKNLNEIDRQEISRYVASGCDNEIPIGVLEQGIVFCLSLGETNGGEQDGLIEIDTIEGDIDQEPRGGGADEGFEMSPLGEVDQEGFRTDVTGRRYDMGFDDGGVAIWFIVNSMGFLIEVLIHTGDFGRQFGDLRGFEGAQLVRLKVFLAFRHA